MWTVPPSARNAARAGHSRSSLPETGTPRVSSRRARPPMPTPPIPIRCTLPRSSAVSSPAGVSSAVFTGPLPQRRNRSSALRHRFEDELQQRLVAVAAAVPRGRGAHRGQPLPVPGERNDRLLDPLGGQVGVVDQDATAGLDHRQRVALLLLVAVRV